MSFNIGDYVVYGGYEICRIEEKVKRCFDGTTPREYYKLIPVYSKGSTYYIPSDDYEEKIRRLLSKEEIYALIEEMPNAEAQWCEDRNQRNIYDEDDLRTEGGAGFKGKEAAGR